MFNKKLRKEIERLEEKIDKLTSSLEIMKEQVLSNQRAIDVIRFLNDAPIFK